MSIPNQDAIPNELLSHLPAADYDHLARITRLKRPPQGAVLRGGDVWFPQTGVVALTTVDAQGRAVQSGLIGRDGCTGAEAIVAPGSVLPDPVVQIEGLFSVVSAPRLAEVMEQRPALGKLLLAFLYGLSIQSTRTIACNRMHSLRARCCRWLLALQDLTASAELRVTQESLSLLLGSGRPRVNQVLGRLQEQRFIRLQRGAVRILDRVGLSRVTCDCYYAVHEMTRLEEPLWPTAIASYP
jgi:hypothetical protein